VTTPAPGAGHTAAVVLAAGLGTRMRSRTPKVLHRLCGRPMLAYVLDAARSATGDRPIVVYSPQTEAIRTVFADEADFALQPEPIGTGDAVRVGLAALPDEVDEVLVLSGDVPRVEPETLVELLEGRRMDAAVMTLVAVAAYDPSGLGRVIRTAAGSVDRIAEEKDATDDELETTEINAGIYAFDAGWLRSRIRDLAPSPATGELYLTELVALARAEGRLVTAISIPDDGRLLGINDRAQLARTEWEMRVDLNEAHMLAGVTMVDPSTVYVDATVTLATDVVLEPNVMLAGATTVGQGTLIGSGSRIVDSDIGSGCTVVASVIERSIVSDGATIGPYSHLRPGSQVGEGAEIGNYAEIKNSRLGRGVKQHHMSYLGDAEVGAGTNVGAGTITANYDGRRKHRTTIGENVFLGVDTMLRAPITLGDGARTGAGAVVTRDVPPGKLAVGMPARIREPRPTEPEVALPGGAEPGVAPGAAGTDADTTPIEAEPPSGGPGVSADPLADAGPGAATERADADERGKGRP
jgi:bifunctional UDP-N-acetylglucosamine pyrophosphorylase/glucosamine-1-phosphate N-acetyltransferase